MYQGQLLQSSCVLVLQRCLVSATIVGSLLARTWAEQLHMFRVRSLIESGKIGKVHHFHGDFICEMPEETERLYDPKLGGGGLLDIGIYPLSIASWVFGRQTPKVVSAMGMVHPRGVDNLGMVNLK